MMRQVIVRQVLVALGTTLLSARQHRQMARRYVAEQANGQVEPSAKATC